MNFNISKISKSYEVNLSKSDNKIKKVKNVEIKNDMLEISDKGKDFQKVLNALSKVPDIREDKVLEIKNKINNNEYNVDYDVLAEKIIKDILL